MLWEYARALSRTREVFLKVFWVQRVHGRWRRGCRGGLVLPVLPAGMRRKASCIEKAALRTSTQLAA